MNWQPIETAMSEISSYRAPKYVLAIDSKGRMAVAYCVAHSTAGAMWISSKPIGQVTHWMPLPEPPK